MKFIKEEDEKRRDYIFQKDQKTKIGARFIGSVLILLVFIVIGSYLYYK